MEKKKLEKRMYFLTMYNISDIQKGIQCGHAALEFVKKFKNDDNVWDFIENDKTWMILNGGTSNDETQSFYGLNKIKGSMEEHVATLKENKIKHAIFREPDLNYSLSAIALIVDERVFNEKDYPAFEGYLVNERKDFSLNFNMPIIEQFPEEYKKWRKTIGEENVFLKEFLSPRNFKLA